MNLNALSNLIEKNIVENEFGWGEEISFTSRVTNITTVVKAMCMAGSYDKPKDEHSTIEDTMTFLSVFLDSRPVRGDKIEYDGIVWEVDRLQGLNPYDIVCNANSRHTAGRSNRREK